MNPSPVILLVFALAVQQLLAQAELPSPPGSGPAASVAPKDTVDSGATDLMLQDQFKSLSKRAEQMQSVLDDVRDAADRVSKAKDSLNQHGLTQEYKATVEQLQTAAASLKALPANTPLAKPESRDNPVGNYLFRYAEVQFAFPQSFRDIIAVAFPSEVSSLNERNQSPNERSAI
jgi:hypothetical protein